MKVKINTNACDCTTCKNKPICAVALDMECAQEAIDKSFRHNELPLEIVAMCSYYVYTSENKEPEF